MNENEFPKIPDNQRNDELVEQLESQAQESDFHVNQEAIEELAESLAAQLGDAPEEDLILPSVEAVTLLEGESVEQILEESVEKVDQVLSELEELMGEDDLTEEVEENDSEVNAESSDEEIIEASESLEVSPQTEEQEAESEFEFELDPFEQKEQEDKLWQARTGLNYESLCGAIETIIFMSDRPISLKKIKSHIDQDLPLRVLHESISRLQSEYEQKHHGIRLMEIADGYQVRTKASYSKDVQSIFKVSSLVLTPSALETLAMIAYKQPISKTALEKIRGVDSSHLVRGLMDKRLVKIVGRSEELGRPSLYGTTPEFLEVFNLNTIEDLPSEYELEQVLNQNEVGKITEIKEVVAGDKTAFNYDEIDELDELASMIKGVNPDTDFTKLLKLEDRQRKNEEGTVARKTAFEILEEFLDSRDVVESNKAAALSEVVTTVMDPRVVDLQIEHGLINYPEQEEDDDFEVMFEEIESDESEEGVDLNSEVDSEEELELDPREVSESEGESDENLDEIEMESLEGETIIEEELISGPTEISEEEKLELGQALDEAFDNLTSGNLTDEQDSLQEQKIDEQLETLDQTMENIIERGKEFDFDFDFSVDSDTKKNGVQDTES